ncbi:YveK family protein [Lacticaseibacillus pantheris]
MDNTVKIGDLINVFWKSIWKMLLLAVICGIGGIATAKYLMPKTYSAEFSVLLSQANKKVSPENSNVQQGYTMAIGTSKDLISSDVVTKPVAKAVSRKYKKMTAGEVASAVTLDNAVNSQIVVVKVASPSKANARVIGKELQTEFVKQANKKVVGTKFNLISKAQNHVSAKGASSKKFAIVGLALGVILGYVWGLASYSSKKKK